MLKIVIFSAVVSLLFPYENKFSFGNSSTGNKISLLHNPELTVIEGGYSRLVKLGDGHINEPGMPEIPQFTTYYQLDPAKTYDFQFEILESYTIENITILPHQGMDKWEVDAVDIINEEIYNSYEAFPEDNMVLSERSQGRGIEFVSISVIPYTYYPKYNRLEVYSSIEIQVIETGENLGNQLNQPKRSHIFDEFYKDIIVNFEYSDRPDDYQAQAILYIGGGSSLSNSYVQDLIAWRHKQGYIVYTATEDEVGGSSASTSEIKNYISDAYYNWDNPPEIVGLIGDTGGSYSLPNYSHSWSGYSGASDFDYTQLDGGDMIPEVFIGRISGSSSNVENIINKTIHYEKADQVEDDWFEKAGLAGDPSSSGNSTIFTNQYIENLMINHGMSDIRTDYDGSGLQSFMNQQFNAGILYYNYRGYYWGAGSYPEGSFNNGYETPFVTTITCGTGDFNYSSSSEEFVWLGSAANPKGAVGAVGMATTGTHTAYNNIVDMGIYDGIFSKNLWYAGAATSNGDLAIMTTYPNPNSAYSAATAFSKWSNLIGDPALHLWSDLPTDFSFTHPDSISLGTTMLAFTITDENGNNVKDARVTLLMGDDVIFTTGMTDDNGQITLNWDAVETGTIDITVIKRNHRPYEGNIEISSASDVAVSMIYNEINVNSGEETDLEISLHNYGTLTATNVIAEISCFSENVSIENNIMSYGNIVTGSSVKHFFPLYIHGTAFAMEDLGIILNITDGDGNNWDNYIPINVIGPYLFIDEYQGVTNPGELTDISFMLNNVGSGDASNFTFELLSYENLVEVTSGIVWIDNLSADEQILLNDFNITLNSSIINGSILPMDLQLTSYDGYTRTQIVNIKVGEVRDSDPVGPDMYGYYFYGDEDTDYDLAPEYNWIEIAEGLGSQIIISDNGNGNCSGNSYSCSSTTLDLPFIFTFYGVDYDQVVVNTNGWISFGNFEMYSFRNYPIPGAGGPSPMVAAFWDDLKTGSSGYVYQYETNEMVVIQWDYMRTYDNGSRETFEIILYNKEYSTPTNTGDSEIKIQYEDFNNTSDGNYNGGTPTHGCYSTIGIENHLGDIGLQYSFNNTYAPGAPSHGGLSDNSAIFITTRTESSYILGDMNGDGELDILDVVTLVNAVLNGDYSASGDMNQDGILDVLDLVMLVNTILS